MKELTTYNINSPSQLSKMADVLKDHILKNRLYTQIAGKNYVHVEGWQFAGGMLGTMPRIKRVENMSKGNEIKWLAEAEIVELKSDKIIGTGIALCSNSEGKKKSFDEYAVLSMAQTRSIGKAYRNILGWVIKLAGYETTPAEEMPIKDIKNTDNNLEVRKITKDEGDNLLRKGLNAGYASKSKLVFAISRLLKTQIRDISDLTFSQYNTVMFAILKKKNK